MLRGQRTRAEERASSGSQRVVVVEGESAAKHVTPRVPWPETLVAPLRPLKESLASFRGGGRISQRPRENREGTGKREKKRKEKKGGNARAVNFSVEYVRRFLPMCSWHVGRVSFSKAFRSRIWVVRASRARGSLARTRRETDIASEVKRSRACDAVDSSPVVFARHV